MATVCCGCGEEVTRARWTGEDGKWVCLDCAPELEIRKNVPGQMFPFVTMHLSNPEHPEPIKVQSLRHLRRLENQHHVQSVAFNMDSSRANEPPQTRRPEFGSSLRRR